MAVITMRPYYRGGHKAGFHCILTITGRIREDFVKNAERLLSKG